MARRWYIPLLALPVVIGSLIAVAVGVASASPGLAHPAARPAAAHTVFPGSPMIRPSGIAMPTLAGNVNTTVASSNWSGYTVTGRAGAFRSVSASWVQPAAHCAGVAGHRYAAFWVGLDGFNSRSVEQTGSDTDCVRNRPTYYGWYEMFPAAPVFFRNPVRAGDHMSASVTFGGAGRGYALVLRDSTRRWTQTIIKHQGGLARSSAEVITEAPATVDQNGNVRILPLADFGRIGYAGGRVNGTLLRLLRPTRILMFDASRRPMDTTSLIGSADAFGNTWIRSF
jgi:Peptidase A4 family